MVIKTVEVEVDLEAFETEDLIEELEERGYSVGEEQENPITEIIETDIRGCVIKTNSRVYQYDGMIKIIVEA